MNILKQRSKRTGRNKVTLIFVAFLLTCGWVVSYWVFLPWTDQVFCIPQITKKLNINEGYGGLVDYVEVRLTPGLTRPQVMQELEELGTVDVKQGKAVVGGVVSDSLIIHICPFTTIQVFANYTIDGHLKYVGVIRD